MTECRDDLAQELAGRLAEQMQRAAAKKAAKKTLRQEHQRRRAYGLQARHASKLRHQSDNRSPLSTTDRQ